MTLTRATLALCILALSTLIAGQAAAQTGLPACLPGDDVQVEWGGSWYDSTVVSGPDAQNQCLIHYDGWSSSWDEWVGVGRMRGYEPVVDACPMGSLVDLPWLMGKPYTAAIVGGPNTWGGCLIEYVGWGRQWHEWEIVETLAPPLLLCNPGQSLSVEWGGSWYDATAISGGDEACLIHYDGWSSSWDESVGLGRMRPR